jgi:hypothetical protein
VISPLGYAGEAAPKHPEIGISCSRSHNTMRRRVRYRRPSHDQIAVPSAHRLDRQVGKPRSIPCFAVDRRGRFPERPDKAIYQKPAAFPRRINAFALRHKMKSNSAPMQSIGSPFI